MNLDSKLKQYINSKLTQKSNHGLKSNNVVPLCFNSTLYFIIFEENFSVGIVFVGFKQKLITFLLKLKKIKLRSCFALPNTSHGFATLLPSTLFRIFFPTFSFTNSRHQQIQYRYIPICRESRYSNITKWRLLCWLLFRG